jgi:hypothetical protein
MRAPIRAASGSLLVALVATGCGAPSASEPAPRRASDHARHAVAPSARLLTALGQATCCMVAHGAEQALYLADIMADKGTLHLIDSASATDTVIAQAVAPGQYSFSPNGHVVLYLVASTDPPVPRNRAPLALHVRNLATGVNTTPVTNGIAVGPLADAVSFSPSGRYAVVLAHVPVRQSSPDLLVFDLTTQAQVLHIPQGAGAYPTAITRDDTLVFENTVLATGAPPIETLFTIPLAQAAGGATPTPTTPITIDQHVAVFALAADHERILYNTTARGLFAVTLDGQQRSQLASDSIGFVGAPAGHDRVAYLAVDGSVHVLDGKRELVRSPAGAAGLQSSLLFGPQGEHVLFFGATDFDNDRGTLFALPAVAGAQPKQLEALASMSDVHFVADRVVDITAVDDAGKTGELVAVGFDGSNAQDLAQTVALGSLSVAHAAGKVTVIGLSQPHEDTMFEPIDGSPSMVGGLQVATMAEGARTLDAAVRAGSIEVSDQEDTLLYVAGASENMAAKTWVGTLTAVDLVADAAAPAAALQGVAEIGPAQGRALLVDAPAAANPGIYLVTY